MCAGSTKIAAPTVMLKMAAASPRTPITRCRAGWATGTGEDMHQGTATLGLHRLSKRRMVLTLIAVLGLAVQQPCDSVLAIWNVSIVPMDSARVLPRRTIVVQGGRIVQVARARARPAHVCWRVIVGTGMYLLPGLADMHVHTRDTSDFTLWLAKGVTTIRILRGSPASLEWRRRSRDGFLLAPTIITSGPFTNLPLIRTPADAWRAAVEQKAAGYDEIKIHGSLEQDTYDSLIAYGRRLN